MKDPIGAHSKIRLEEPHAISGCLLEGKHRVLGPQKTGTPVGDHDRGGPVEDRPHLAGRANAALGPRLTRGELAGDAVFQTLGGREVDVLASRDRDLRPGGGVPALAG